MFHQQAEYLTIGLKMFEANVSNIDVLFPLVG
jgi:hypothetical protein